MPAVEYSKKFITSLVVGKDIVVRMGLSQMESLRTDLLDCIKRSTDTKVHGRLKNTFCYRTKVRDGAGVLQVSLV